MPDDAGTGHNNVAPAILHQCINFDHALILLVNTKPSFMLILYHAARLHGQT
jgi:hypothetical protein